MNMGWSASEMKCKKHPNQKQQPGVCSSCLEERLSQLYTCSSHFNKTATASYSFSSSLSYTPDNASSNYASPNNRRRRNHHHHQRHGSSDVLSSISLMISNGGNIGLKKSRSMTFVRRNRVGDAANGKKKGGFWSKLLHSTGKRTKEVFMHSRTLRERFQ